MVARAHDPIVAIFADEEGDDVVRYVLEDGAGAAVQDEATRAALAAIGSCGDLDWNTWAEALDQIRHQSPPTPPIDG
jgi:hypothetical protein